MRILGLIAILFFCHSGLASEKVRIGPEPAWLYKVSADPTRKPAAKEISNGYYVQFLDHQVNLAAQTDYTHVIRQVVNETGVQNESEISVTFSPEFQEVVFHRVQLIRNGTAINQLDKRQIKVVQEDNEAEDFLYNGLKRAYILLKDVQKGDRIEVAYSLIGFNPVFANKYSDKLYFSHSTAVCNYFETLLVPAGRKVVLRAFNKAALPQQLSQNGLVVYQWSNPVLKSYQSADNTPSWYDDDPYVSISEFDSWQQVVNWGLETFHNYQYPLPSVLKEKTDKWLAAAHGDKDLFATEAIRFVQDQVRYQGLEIGTYTHQPHAPSDVYKQRFGDCKDKALLLTMILQQQGIPAYIALVNTSVRSKLAEAAPSAGEFDHAIVAIERGKNYLYVDATDAGQRGELVNLYIPAYGYALIIKPGEDKLEPVEPGFLNATSIEAKLDVKYDDSSRLKVETTCLGGSADGLRSSLSGYSATELEDDYLQYYSKTYEGIKHASPVETKDDSIKNEITVNESYLIPQIFQLGRKGRESFEVFAKPIYEELPNPSAAATGAPLALSFPASIRYRMVIDMPDAWNIGFEETHVKNDSYQFDFVPELTGSRIVVRYYWKSFRDHIAPADVKQYKKDYKGMMEVIDFDLYHNSGDRLSETSAYAGREINIEWGVAVYALLLAAGIILLLRHFDKYTINRPVAQEDQLALGGWVIVLGVGLLLSALIQFGSLFSFNYFSKDLWATLQETGGRRMQVLQLVELTLVVIQLCSIIALLYWYANRRDIFPQLFLWYLGIMIGGTLLMTFLDGLVPPKELSHPMLLKIVPRLVQGVLYAAIWGTYVIRSERVRYTFTRDR